jgi:hypothetical protein
LNKHSHPAGAWCGIAIIKYHCFPTLLTIGNLQPYYIIIILICLK